MTRRPWTRAAVVLPVAAALLAGAGGTAYAVAKARATASQAVGTGTFGAQPSTSATASSQAGPLVLAYLGQDKDARLLFLRNAGTLPLRGQTWTLSIANTSGGAKGEASLVHCSTGYTATLTCAGTETVFLTANELSATAPVSATTSFPVPVGGAVSVKFQPNLIRGYNATIGSSVSRAQAAPATVSAS